MRYGIVILPEHRWSVAEPLWRRAEAMGFDHAWTYDHLAWRSLADGPWFGTFPTLTAAAMVTSRIRLGTFVASPNFRHPVPLVREILSVDDISGGRFTFGVGAGGVGFDSTVLGQDVLPPRQRMARLTEFVDLLDRLLTSDRVDHQGEFFTAVQARTAPGCVQQPRVPFAIAANGPVGMRLAARLGQGWITTGTDREGTAEQWWKSVAALCTRYNDTLASLDVEPKSIDRFLGLDAGPVFALSSVDCFTDYAGRAAELGFTDVIAHWPRPEGVHAGSEDILERVAADVLTPSSHR